MKLKRMAFEQSPVAQLQNERFRILRTATLYTSVSPPEFRGTFSRVP
jgi:hypothetical protein